MAGDDRRIPAGAASATGGVVLFRRLLVVLLFDVHAPDVVAGAGGDVLGREHRRVHRVVLVVVAVHAVAPDGVDVRRAVVEPLDDAGHIGLVVLVVEGIRLGHPHDVAGFDLVGGDEPEDAQLAFAL